MAAEEEPREGSMEVRDGRTVAWTEWGPPEGRPLVRVPGTPGSRWAVRADRRPWAERGLRVVTTERPGMGASTRLPRRRFREHAVAPLTSWPCASTTPSGSPPRRESFRRSVLEALRAGPDGWADEVLARGGPWDVDAADVPTSVTWYHAVEDRNSPVAAARRLVGRLPAGRLVEWTSAGHLTAYHLEGEILDELLARG